MREALGMDRDAPPDSRDQIARALAHPMRSAIMRLLIGTSGLSPKVISEKLETTAARVRYHVDVLTECGAVEAVKDGGRADELLIRLAPLPSERKPGRTEVADGLRDDISEAQLRNLIEIAGDLGIGYEGRGA